ncbi:unnamed protein product [Paramecium sonneborni]|uniref:WD40-repeat-containing domain n=1 Tax=Paramecium sonneborni TaxID=65129 RepID=A0A8S1NHM9_9CILI|nr:unnamed protein product [Paramecium sonneborni]
MSLITPKIFCQDHRDITVSLLNLTTCYQEKILYCYRCNLNQKSSLYCLEDIFCFVNSLKKSEQESIAKITQDKEKLVQIKNSINQISAYYNKLEKEHQELLDLVIKNQIIKKNDQIEIFLQKQQLCDQKELIQLAEQVSHIIKQNSDKLELLEGKSIKYDDQHQQLREKIKYLQEQLKNVNQYLIDDGQSIIFLKYPSLYKLQEQKKKQNFEFLKIAEIQLEQTKIYDVKFNKKNNLFVLGSSKLKDCNCYAQIWKCEKGLVQKIQDLNNSHSNDVKCICFSISDDSFFTGSQDSKIIYWKKESSQWYKDQVLEGQSNGIMNLSLNNKGNFLAAISINIHLWTKQSQKWEKAQILNECRKYFLCLNFNNDDSYLVAGSSDCKIYIYKFQNGQWKFQNIIKDQSQEVNFITFQNDLNLMGILKDNNMNYYYSKNDGFELKYTLQLPAHQVSYSKKRQTLIVSSGTTKETSIYQIEEQEGIKKIKSMQVKSEQVYQSDDGSFLAILADQRLQFYQELIDY